MSYALSGTAFSIDEATGQIMVGTGTMLDFETQGSYMVTVTATGEGGSMEMMVTISVTNVEEEGSVILSTETPRAGAEIMATIEDGDIVDNATVSWRWESSADGADPWAPITGATDASYIVAQTDDGMFLRISVSYTDGFGPGEAVSPATASAVTGNVAPEFATATAERSVAENTAAGENIGAAVEATDADTGDNLTYTLVARTWRPSPSTRIRGS